MSNRLKFRGHLLAYRRDTYLGETPKLAQRRPIIDCAVGYAQWGISTLALRAHQAFDPELVRPYPELFHTTLLKPAVLARFEKSGISAEQVFFGHGSFNLAERIVHKLIEPSCMLGVGPQFNEIPSEFVATGGTYNPIPIHEGSYAFPEDRLLDALRTGAYSVLYLDNPNNPLGRVVSLHTLTRIIMCAQDHGTIVVIDEAYGDATMDEMSAVNLVNSVNNLIVLRSCSKVLGLAALRVGYMVVSPGELASVYGQLDVPFEPTIHAATLAAATLQDNAFLVSVRRQILDTKRVVTSAFERAGYMILPTHPGVPIFVIHRPGSNVVQELAQVDVMVDPGHAFIQTHTLWDDSYCRIRIPSPELTNQLLERINLLGEES